MQCPIGYGVIALLVALMSLSSLTGAALTPSTLQGVTVPTMQRLLASTAGVLGLWAAWWVWTYRRTAPEAYATWAVIITASGVYSQLVVVPRMLEAVQRQLDPQQPVPQVGLLALLPVLFYSALLGIGYWYLQARRRPAVN
jgi:hypothetical protein